MGIKRIVDTTFWTDPDVVDLYSCEDKYFLLYLLTNPHTKQCGIYSLPKKYMAFETGYSKECIEVLIDRFSKKYQKIIYNNGTQEIAVLNSLKYSVVKGGKPVEDCIKKDLSEVKDNLLIRKTYNHLLDFWNSSKRPFDQNIKSIFEEMIQKESTKERTNDNDNDNDNDNEESLANRGRIVSKNNPIPLNPVNTKKITAKEYIHWRDKDTCFYTQRVLSNSEIQIDHINSLGKDGKSTRDNMVICFTAFNYFKANKLLADAIAEWNECHEENIIDANGVETRLKKLQEFESLRTEHKISYRETIDNELRTAEDILNFIDQRKPQKKEFAKFVSLTQKEYDSLIEKVGSEEAAKKCVEILNNYKGATGKTYKSDYYAMLSWVIDRYKEANNGKHNVARNTEPAQIPDKYKNFYK